MASRPNAKRKRSEIPTSPVKSNDQMSLILSMFEPSMENFVRRLIAQINTHPLMNQPVNFCLPKFNAKKIKIDSNDSKENQYPKKL